MNIKKIIKEAHVPNYASPSLEDTSYVLLNLSLGVIKRSIYELVLFNIFSEENEKMLIDKGVKMIEGKLTVDSYIKELEKTLKKESNKDFKFDDALVSQITMRLQPTIDQTTKKLDLTKETSKSVKKDGTLKKESYAIVNNKEEDLERSLTSPTEADKKALSEDNTTESRIDPRFLALPEKDRVIVLKAIGELRLPFDGVVTRQTVDKVVQGFKKHYQKQSPQMKYIIDTLLTTLDPNDFKKFTSKDRELFLNSEEKSSLESKLNESALEDAKKEAQEISSKEGVVQHVNEVSPGKYQVSDWYDSETTVVSYEFGHLKESESQENLEEAITSKELRVLSDFAENNDLDLSKVKEEWNAVRENYKNVVDYVKEVESNQDFEFLKSDDEDEEQLEEANVLEPQSKDYMRITDLIRKGKILDMKGRYRPGVGARQLAQTMANKITDVSKAWRRYKAAEDENYHDLALIFYKRFRDLEKHSVSESVLEEAIEYTIGKNQPVHYNPEEKIFVAFSSDLNLSPRDWNSLVKIPKEKEIVLSNKKTGKSYTFTYKNWESMDSDKNEVGNWNYDTTLEDGTIIKLTIFND